MEKKFRISFDVVMVSEPDCSKEVFEYIAREENMKSSILAVLEREFIFDVKSLKVEELKEGEQNG